MVSGARAYFLDGNLGEAKRWLNRALDTDGATYSLWRVNALGSLGLVVAWAGNLVRANELATEALATAREVGLLTHWASADAYMALAHIALERGEPPEDWSGSVDVEPEEDSLRGDASDGDRDLRASPLDGIDLFD